ncbi:MAG: hypothetical protein WBA93_16340 [Microcoleaceae cyanobacterium]
MGRWGDGEMGKYLVMVEDGTFLLAELNGFDIKIKIEFNSIFGVAETLYEFHQLNNLKVLYNITSGSIGIIR